MLPILMLVGMQFKLALIQTASVGIAVVLGSGVATVDPDGGFHLQGTGLVINTGITAALAVAAVLWVGPRLGNYTILLLSTIVVITAGTIGWVVTYLAVRAFSVWLGDVINGATGFQPIAMGAILSLAFCLAIVSPISTVGIATAIYMSGVAAGTANLGVVAAGFGLAIAGWKANGMATSLLPVLGSPKVHMASIWGRPLNFLPLALTSVTLGGGNWWCFRNLRYPNLSRFWNFRACGTACCAKCRGMGLVCRKHCNHLYSVRHRSHRVVHCLF